MAFDWTTLGDQHSAELDFQRKKQQKQVAQVPQGDGGIVGFLQGMGKSVGANYNMVGTGLANALSEATGQEQAQRNRNAVSGKQDVETIKALGQKLKAAKASGDTAAQKRLQDAISKITNTSIQGDQALIGRQDEIIRQNDPTKNAAGVASIGLDLLGGGAGGSLLTGGIRRAVLGGAKQGAGFGALQGALHPVIEKGNGATSEDIFGNAAVGLGMGAAFGGGFGLAGKTASSLLPGGKVNSFVRGNKPATTPPGGSTGNQVLDNAVTAPVGGHKTMPANASRTPQPANGLEYDLPPMKTSTAGRLTDFGNKALLSQYGTISKPIARSTNPTQTIAQLADAGILSPNDAERVAMGITGSNGLITDATAKAVDGVGNVDVSTLKQIFHNAADDVGLIGRDRKQVETMLDAQLNRLNGEGGANGTNTLGVMKSLEQRIAEVTGKGETHHLPNSIDADKAKVLRHIHDELENQLYVGAGANDNLGGVLTPELRQKLIDLHPNEKAWANYVDNNIMGVQSVDQLRSSVAPFVRAGKIINEGDVNALTYGGRVGNAFADNSIRGALGNVVTNVVKNPVAKQTGKALRAAGTKANRGGVPPNRGGEAGSIAVPELSDEFLLQNSGNPVVTTGIQRLLGDLGTPAIAQGVASMQPDQQQLPQDLDPTADLALDGGLTDTGATGTSNPFGTSLEEVASQMKNALAAGDMKGYGVLGDLYDKISKYEQDSASNGGGASATTKGSLASSANAIGTIDQLEQLFTKAGGGAGRLGGTIQNLLANAGFDENAKVYNSLSQASVTQIAKALAGAGSGTVSDMDAKVIIAALPTISDTPDEARAKFEALRQRLSTAQQNAYSYGAGSSSLEDLLAGYK